MEKFKMCIVFLILSTAVAASPGTYGSQGLLDKYNAPCRKVEDVTPEYRKAIDDFVIASYKIATAQSSFNLVYSPPAMWAALAAIAEGAEPQAQQELFKLLQLPNNRCVRQQFYKLVTSRLLPGPDIHISNTRLLVIDEGITVNASWYNFVTRNSLIDVISAPIKSNPDVALNEMRRVIAAKLPKLDLNGNSVLLEAMDFSGLWTTAFPDAAVEREPFYAPNGQILGYVDLMKIRKQVKMGYAPNLKAKVLELPLGGDSRYSLIYAMVFENADSLNIIENLHGSIINEALSSLQESAIPIDIAVPQYTMTSELNVRSLLEGLGLTNIWNDSSVSRFISEPAARPSGYVQRVTITIRPSGVSTAPFVTAAPADMPTGLHPKAGRDFIANQPHMFGLYDYQTRTCVLASAFGQPTYAL